MNRILKLTLFAGLAVAPGAVDRSLGPVSGARAEDRAAVRLLLPPTAQVGASREQMLWAMGFRREAWHPQVNQEKSRGAAAELYARLAPAIVVIKAEDSLGTGFFVDPQGWLITNRHVVKDAPVDPRSGVPTASIFLGKLDGDFMRLVDEGIPAMIYKMSEEKDLALLKLVHMPPGLKSVPSVRLSAEAARPGDECIVLGHPRAATLWTVRGGVVAGMGRWPQEMTQEAVKRLALREGRDRQRLSETYAAGPQVKVLVSNCGVNFGDSGGPLLNTKGELIGVTFAIPSAEATGGSATSFSYHIHLDEVKAFLADRPKEPMLYVPDPWPPGVFSALVDLDDDGIPDTLVFGMRRGGPPTGLLFDLREQNARKLKDIDASELGNRHSWTFQVALHLQPVTRAFYDTDNTGRINLILTGQDSRGRAESALRLTSGKWTPEDAKGRKLLDPSLIDDVALRKRFVKILANLE
jgi:serine protease Do